MANVAMDTLFSSNEIKDAVRLLLGWYSDLRPDAVELTGEYAGRELFMIEGDSLLRHVFRTGRVDMDEGLQVLHAVAEVERFLLALRSRRCHFHVVFIDEHRQLCIPEYAPASRGYKFLYVRECVVRHLMHYGQSTVESEQVRFFSYDSANSEGLRAYLKAYRPYFILTHDGAFDPLQREYAAGRPLTRETVMLRIFIWRMVEQGFHVALINEITVIDWQVMTYVMNVGKLQVYQPQVSPFLHEAVQALKLSDNPAQITLDSESDSLRQEASGVLSKLASGREVIHLLALRRLLSSTSNREFINLVPPFLYHLSLLQYLPLDQRRAPDVSFNLGDDIDSTNSQHEEFLRELLKIEIQILRVGGSAINSDTRKFDIYDAIDGRLFRLVLCKWSSLGNGNDNQAVTGYFKGLCNILGESMDQLIPSDFGPSLSLSGAVREAENRAHDHQAANAVLPFSNSVFDAHLSSINIDTVDQSRQHNVFPALDVFERQVCQAKSKTRALEMKKNAAVTKEWWVLKGEQKNQLSIQRYAASLTGASGRELKPERIITDPGSNKPTQGQKQNQKAKPSGSAKIGKAVAADKKKGAGTKKTAEVIREANTLAKADEQTKKAAAAWKTFRTKTLDGIKSLRDKLAALDKYIQSSISEPYVKVEAKLLRVYLLQSIWVDEYCSKLGAGTNKASGYGIPALILHEASQLLSDSFLTKPIKQCLEAAFAALGFALPKVPEPTPFLGKPLTLPLDASRFKLLHVDTRVGMDLKEFQLKHCGLYMERNLDSKEDSRVAFTPDAWQIKVLDALDADKSALVVAPTSAGKTFIGYYAMEKILKADDDGVLVYVAPTKALVNQIAAELQARFIKDYKHPGKSLWAIATREYKIHNPLSCQILITVPYVFHTMLLSPQNAKTWAPKIKRIIFDEIHCLGSQEDGEVWEQLVLLAPCPIIAMSATIGNPKEFHQWLQTTQKRLRAKGKSGKGEPPEVVLIEHKHRFNDLRKYHYQPPQTTLDLSSAAVRTFEGLKPTPPTIGTTMGGDENFQHIHPITAMGDGLEAIPGDLSLESADCFSLWQTMCKVQSEKFKVPEELHYAKFFPELIRKADVIKWEERLKALLTKWMKEPESPFRRVIEMLQSQVPSANVQKAVEYVNDIIEDAEEDAQLDEHGEAEQESEEATSAISTRREMFEENATNALRSTLDMLNQLNAKNALPAILFNYSSTVVEFIAKYLTRQLGQGEQHWRANSTEWKKKMSARDAWLKQTELAAARKQSGKKAKPDPKEKDEGNSANPKVDRMLNEQEDVAAIASFDPDDPSENFTFSGGKVYSKEDLARDIGDLQKRGKIDPLLIEGIKRGIGCHHAALPRPYRECVERLFRKGFLRVLIATGTLALGINMPCQTVCFIDDDLLLTPLNYRQASGRAGRRGFDLLGNVIFQGIPLERAHRLIRSRIPDLNGHFPTSPSLILRLCILLHGSGGSEFACNVIHNFLSQARLSLGDRSTREQVLYCIRFSIEYLMRQGLLTGKGEPLIFAPLAASLHFERSGSFTLAYLLRTGQLWKELSDLEGYPEGSDAAKELRSRKLMLILAHLFVRRRLRPADVDETGRVLTSGLKPLPELSPRILSTLEAHNQQVLDLARCYAVTYAQNYITAAKAEHFEVLPLTGVSPHPNASKEIPDKPLLELGATHSAIYAQSIFATLSNHTDYFESMNDVFWSCHPSIHFLLGWLPYQEIGPSVKLNPYLYEFFASGGTETSISKSCRIRKANVWFLLDDFRKALVTMTVGVGSVVVEKGLLGWDEYVVAGEKEMDYNKLDEEVGKVKDEVEAREEYGRPSEIDDKRRELVEVYFAMREVQKVFNERLEDIAATKRVKKGKNYGKAGQDGKDGKSK